MLTVIESPRFPTGQPSDMLPSPSSGAVMAPLYLLPSIILLVLLLLLLWRNGILLRSYNVNAESQISF